MKLVTYSHTWQPYLRNCLCGPSPPKSGRVWKKCVDYVWPQNHHYPPSLHPPPLSSSCHRNLHGQVSSCRLEIVLPACVVEVKLWGFPYHQKEPWYCWIPSDGSRKKDLLASLRVLQLLILVRRTSSYKIRASQTSEQTQLLRLTLANTCVIFREPGRVRRVRRNLRRKYGLMLGNICTDNTGASISCLIFNSDVTAASLIYCVYLCPAVTSSSCSSHLLLLYHLNDTEVGVWQFLKCF